MINLYSTDCSRCIVLENRLNQKSFKFNKITDNETIMKKAMEYNIMTVPFCEINNDVKTYTEVLEWVNNS